MLNWFSATLRTWLYPASVSTARSCDSPACEPRPRPTGWESEAGTLHTVLSRLRSALGDGVLRAGPAGYSIDPGPGGLDADRFEALRGQAAEASAARAAALFDEALAL